MDRNIPRMAMMNVLSSDDDEDGTYQVIDGKQRLSAMIDFYNNKYTLLIDENEYLFKELPIDYQNAISRYHFAYYIAYEQTKNAFTDSDKIQWFTYINFAGTQQDATHFTKLK